MDHFFSSSDLQILDDVFPSFKRSQHLDLEDGKDGSDNVGFQEEDQDKEKVPRNHILYVRYSNLYFIILYSKICIDGPFYLLKKYTVIMLRKEFFKNYIAYYLTVCKLAKFLQLLFHLSFSSLEILVSAFGVAYLSNNVCTSGKYRVYLIIMVRLTSRGRPTQGFPFYTVIFLCCSSKQSNAEIFYNVTICLLAGLHPDHLFFPVER